MTDHFTLKQIIAIEQASRRYIRVKKVYVDMVNNLHAGAVLSEIFYWHMPSKEGKSRLRTIPDEKEKWLACRRQSWWDRSRLTPREFDRALEKLLKAKLVFKKNFDYKGQDTLHVRINWPVFEEAYNRAIETQNPKAKKRRVILKGLPDAWDFIILLLRLEVLPIGDTPLPTGNTLSPIGETESPTGDTYTTIDTTQVTTKRLQEEILSASNDTSTTEPLSSLRSEPSSKSDDHLDAFEEFVDTLIPDDEYVDINLEDEPKPTLYECTQKDIASMIAAWWEWVPARPTVRGKVGTLADHMKVPTNREYAKNLFERGVRPIDFVRVLAPLYLAAKKSGQPAKEMAFQYVCPIADQYCAEHWREDIISYNQDDPRWVPKKPGAKGVTLGEDMWLRDDYFVDVPVRYISVADLEDPREDETEDMSSERLPEESWTAEDWEANGEPL